MKGDDEEWIAAWGGFRMGSLRMGIWMDHEVDVALVEFK